ncbi:hypothetical protein NE619_16980 [Anaerovorax odorimutans]|uniref:DUF5626 domain-containing protein n=1 Tax=Anaerovorax odorimutans TaxID=109327 RepID=A0ABT1RTC3_9FIRM|nr:hypothetical protein [Anaerovorax odorimutans]MCQ4638427.1 hypothetical protein [Anaerovorax odorimutans]
MKKLILVLLMISVLAFSSSVTCFAAESADNANVEYEYYDDGSYATIETAIEQSITPYSTTKKKSATRTYTYYNASKKRAWSFSLKGTFQYNGKTAKAISSSPSSQIFISGWKCTSKRSIESGSSVKGYGTFTYKSLTKHVPSPFGLKCSANGTISSI